MRQIFLSLLFLLACSTTFAQLKPGTTTLTLTVMQDNGKPMSGTEVEFRETETDDVVQITTDEAGKVSVVLDKGRYWQINIRDIQNWHHWQIENRPGMKTTFTKTITYDMDAFLHDTRPFVDRKTIQFTDIQQNIVATLTPTATETVVRLTILKSDKSPLREYPVVLTCLENKTRYISKTNQAGMAQFLVPVNKEYDIDIDVVENFYFVKLGKAPVVHNQTITYQPCVFNEFVKGDTIHQNLSPNDGSCSNASMMTMTVKKTDGSFWENEPVFFKDLADTNKVITAKTDEEGKVRFLLKKGHSYRIDFTKQKFAGKVDLKQVRGIGYLNRTIVYRPVEPKLAVNQPILNPEPPAHLELKPLKTSDEVRSLLAGSGVEILDLHIRSLYNDAVNLTEFKDSKKVNGMDWGMLLTTGNYKNAVGPNTYGSATWIWSNQPVEDSLLNSLNTSGDYLFDACIIEMTIRTNGKSLTLDYLMGSEEYPEWLDYHDLAGIFFWGGEYGNKPRNIAYLPDFMSRVSVATVNHRKNAQWYKSSDASPLLQQTWQYDGFTIPMTVTRPVTQGGIYKIRIIVADHRDPLFDTGFFIGAHSLRCK